MRPHWRATAALIVLTSAFSPLTAAARDMQGRLGVGYNNQFVSEVPSISLKYALAKDLAVQGIFGVISRSPSRSVTGLKLMKNVFFGTNMNFYFMGGAALVSANGASGSQFIGGLGAEFFIPGLESLGFSVETGASMDNLGGGYAFRTLGLSFLTAGIHFYF